MDNVTKNRSKDSFRQVHVRVWERDYLASTCSGPGEV